MKNNLQIDLIVYKDNNKYALVSEKRWSGFWNSKEEAISFASAFPLKEQNFDDMEIVDLLQYTWTARYLKSILSKKLIPFVV